MMGPETMAVTYGIGSALIWGASDFSGGFATRRGNVLMVILLAHILGALFLMALIPVFSETMPGGRCLMWGALAGISGALGLAALYRGLALGRMGIVAPLSAVISAVAPLVFGLISEGVPPVPRLVGFGVALAAVWCLSAPGSGSTIAKTEFYLASLAGLACGFFFICIDRASTAAILWPLLSARFASIILIFLILMARRRVSSPVRAQLPFIVLVGILDTSGNMFFALAAQLGRLDVTALLGAMYPAFTVLLAWLVLKERLRGLQWAGVLAAILALVLIAA